MSFKGKVALITGGSSGIGANVASHLAKLGANVSIVGRNKERLDKVADTIKNDGSPTPLAIVADVTKDAEQIVNETIEHFGKLDILINNAGFAISDNVVEANLSEFDRVFDTNVRSVIALTKLCVPHLEKTKGNIVNVSSLAGLRAFPNFMTYCMSKAALEQFSKCSALDLASKGIRVNLISPAHVRTSFLQPLGVSAEQAVQMYEAAKSQYPLGRIGEVGDTSAAIAFLADNNVASFLTGVSLPVDGGLLVSGVIMDKNQP